MVSDYITIKKAAGELGLTVSAIRSKIYRGQWRDGIEYTHGPDRRIYLRRSAVERWIAGNQVIPKP